MTFSFYLSLTYFKIFEVTRPGGHIFWGVFSNLVSSFPIWSILNKKWYNFWNIDAIDVKLSQNEYYDKKQLLWNFEKNPNWWRHFLENSIFSRIRYFLPGKINMTISFWCPQMENLRLYYGSSFFGGVNRFHSTNTWKVIVIPFRGIFVCEFRSFVVQNCDFTMTSSPNIKNNDCF